MAPCLVQAEWRIEAATGTIYDSNLSNSDRSADEKDDLAWETEVRLGNGFQLTRDLRLSFAGDLRAQLWSRFDAFNVVTPGGAASLRYRFGLGPTAPWALVENHLDYSAFHEDERSGYRNRLSGRAGLGVSERLALEVAYTFDKFEARERFWDASGHSGSLRVTYEATATLQLALQYSYRGGDVFSYALPPRPDIVAIAAELDSVPSFGQPAYTAYRVQGESNALSISADYTLGKVSLQLNYEFRDTTHGSLEYINNLVEAKIALTF